MPDILLVGAGGHANSCIDVLETSGVYNIAGLVEKDNHNANSTNLGYPIIGSDRDLSKLRETYKYALVAVGQIKSPEIRIKIFHKLIELKYELPVIISPYSHVSNHASIAEGTIIMHHSVVNANSKIGVNCIINNKTLIEHDAIIGDHCHISTGAIINGNVTVKQGTFIGSATTVIQCIEIGEKCVIGAGLTINNTIASKSIVKR